MSLAQLFLLCALMAVVVHSFVADSGLLDCCDLVVFFFFFFFFGGGGGGGDCFGCFFHLLFAGRQPFGVLRWFQLFFLFFFHLVSAACLTD